MDSLLRAFDCRFYMIVPSWRACYDQTLCLIWPDSQRQRKKRFVVTTPYFLHSMWMQHQGVLRLVRPVGEVENNLKFNVITICQDAVFKNFCSNQFSCNWVFHLTHLSPVQYWFTWRYAKVFIHRKVTRCHTQLNSRLNCWWKDGD